MEFLSVILTVALVHFLAVLSPGPDFIMVVRNTLIYSRKTGIYSAIGLGLGILVHVTYSLVGIGLLIAKSILLFDLINAKQAPRHVVATGRRRPSERRETLRSKGLWLRAREGDRSEP